MNKFLTSSLLAVVFVLGTAPVYAGGLFSSNDDCNGVGNCNNTTQYGGQGGHGGLGIGKGGDATSVAGAAAGATSISGSAAGAHAAGGDGGTAVLRDNTLKGGSAHQSQGFGVGDIGSTSSVGDVSNRNRNTNTAKGGTALSGSASGVYGSGNSASVSEGGDVRHSGNSDVDNKVGVGVGVGVDTGDYNSVDNRDYNKVGVGVDTTDFNSNKQGQGQDQAQGQKQGQAIVGSGNSRTNVGQGQSMGDNETYVGVANKVGQGQSMGDQTTSVGDQTTDVVTGDVATSTSTSTSTDQSQSTTVDGNNSSNVGVEEGGIQIADNSSTVVEAPDIPVSTAAPSFASICTSGSSGQGPNFGFSIAVTSDTCRHLVMADAYMALVRVDAELGDAEGVKENYEAAMKHVERAAGHADLQGFMGRIRHVITLGIL